jgi:hypothetical protein
LFRFQRSSRALSLAFNRDAEKSMGATDMAYVFEALPADRAVINLNDPREVSWWRKRFGCSEDQLRQAVAEVGRSAAKVEQLLDGSQLNSV